MTEGMVGIILGMGVMAFVIAIVWYVLQVVAKWKMFTKMDEAGWKSIIPIYSDYILYKRTWKASFFWVMIVIALISGCLQSASSTFAAVVAAILVIAAVVIYIIQLDKMSKSFGHGAGFTVGLLFFYPIFMLILGLGSSQYIGNTSEQ